MHSRYQRRLADAALGGRQLLIVLSVRRLFCDHDRCSRRTFTEQVEGLTVRYARRTPLLRSMLEQVAVGGRAGARLARSLAVAASRSTLLRLVIAYPTLRRPRRGCWAWTTSRCAAATSTALC